MTLMERRRRMMGAKAEEPNGLADKPLTSISNGSYEVINGTIYIYPTISHFNYIYTPFKKKVLIKHGDVISIKAKRVSVDFFAVFSVDTTIGSISVATNTYVYTSMNLSKTIDTDCEILAFNFANRAGGFTNNAQYEFTFLLNNEIIF